MTTRELHGRNVFVTGATSGIGEAIARTLSAAGARVVVGGRDADRGEKLVADLPDAAFLPSDLSADAAHVRDIAARAGDLLDGRVDILVNNAGIYPVGPTATTTDADLDAVWAVNVRAPHVLVGELAPAMAGRGTGSIVNVGSWMARVGVPMGAIYTASKAANEQMTRTWAAEFGPAGVRVNTVAPGITLTPGNDHAREQVELQASGTPAAHPLSPQDVADAVLFLVSDSARMVQGALLDVDGGLSATRLRW